MSPQAAGSEGAWAIDVRGLTKRYGERAVVDGVDLRLRPGRICGFLGPNGSGKTTTIRMLCGLLTPDAGEGSCLGLDIVGERLQIRRQVGYMTQRFGLYEDLSIRQNLDFVARLFELPQRKRRVDEALDGLGLGSRAQQLAGSLSGGWKQRLALAACLLHDPRLLLLDEPTAGVDPKARRDFWDQIHHLAARGVTVLVSTHYMDEAERCHELIYIAYGHILARGTAEQIIEQAGLTVWSVQVERATPGDDGSADRNQQRVLPDLIDRLKAAAGVDSVAAFGSSVHVAGRDRQAIEAAIAPWREHADLRWTATTANLEDVFIGLVAQASDNYGENEAKSTGAGR